MDHLMNRCQLCDEKLLITVQIPLTNFTYKLVKKLGEQRQRKTEQELIVNSKNVK